jgi:hypothetical protein
MPPPPDPAFDPDIAPPDAPHRHRKEDRMLVGSPEAPIIRTGAAGAPTQVVTDDEEEQVALTPQESLDLRHLAVIGRRIKEIVVYGHRVVISTLNADDDINVGMYTKPYLGSDAYGRSHQVATLAAAIQSFDGRPVYQDIQDQAPEFLHRKKAEIIRKWYPVVISEIYGEQVKLDGEYVELLDKLGK